MIKNHALLALATALQAADDDCCNLLTDAVIEGILASIPDEWLQLGNDGEGSAETQRNAYSTFLKERRNLSGVFLQNSKVHTWFFNDLEAETKRLFEVLVG